MRKKIKKLGSFLLAFTLVLSNLTFVNALELPKTPILFEDFENSTNEIVANNDTTVEVTTDLVDANNKVLKMTTSSSDWPHMTYRSTIVKFADKDKSIDVSLYKYLTFKVYENDVHDARSSLIDINGNTVDGEWTTSKSVKGKWTQLSIELDKFKDKIDLTKIVGLYIGEWNEGTYYFDDIMFTDVLNSDLNVNANKNSGTYYHPFELKLSTNEGYHIYYTTDNTTPNSSSQLYTDTITIDHSMTVKTLVEVNGNIGEVQSFEYIISDEINAPYVFEDFEDSTHSFKANHDATVALTNDYTKVGTQVLELKVTSSDWPDKDNRSTTIRLTDETKSIDVSDYSYLAFNMLDKHQNSARVSLIDINGNMVDGEWTGDAIAGQWTQLSIPLSKFKDAIDLTKIVGLYIGEWNEGTYYIDDIIFTNILDSELAVKASKDSGTYYDSFKVELSANEDLKIYYTTDGSLPTLDSSVYKEAIEIDDSLTIKAITEIKGNVSNIYEFKYIIDHEDKRIFTPVIVQTFEDGEHFKTLKDASGSISTDEKHSGNKSLKYEKTKSEGSSTDKGSIVIDFNHAVNVESLNYLVFYFKDTQGNNTMQISLIDALGNESSFSWRELSTKKDEWVQYYVKLSDFDNIDKQQVVGMRIGQWNAGTYYVDDIYFDNYLYTGLPQLKPSAPKASIASNYIFTHELSVELKNDNNADMYYTLDGTTPTKDSMKYNETIVIDSSKTLKVVSYDNGTYSDVVSYEYIRNDEMISDVESNKQSGHYSKAFEVNLSQKDDYTIYYTTDGTMPSLDSKIYTSAIKINETTTIKAFAYHNGLKGNIITFEYIMPKVPSIVTTNHNEFVFNTTTNVELISNLDADIYYTLDGSEPTIDSLHYDEPISVSKTTTIKAIAVCNDFITKVASYDFVIAPKAVIADKPAGEYDGSVLVEFRVPDTDQVEIYYTTDGSEPTLKSTHYVEPIIVSEDVTFKVAATYKNSTSLSESSKYTFIIHPILDVVAPKVSPESGIYGQRQLVTMSTDTVDGDIYYTLDGTTPTKDSLKYTNVFMVSKDTTVKAITVKNGEYSDVVTRNIKITNEESPFLKVDGEVIRNNYGGGDIVTLKGTNIGGWLVTEEWQCPTNAKDQLTMLNVLTERFGEEEAWNLLNLYQDNWITEDDIRLLKQEGVNCLRLPITYFEMANTDGTLKETAFKRLDWFVETAAKYEIYTMIDMHGAFGSQNGKDHSGDITYPDVGNFYGNEENIQKTIKLWEAIAKRFKDNEWVCGYDLLNEPSAVGTEQFEVYDRLYDAIRAIDQNHIIYMQAIWEPCHLPDPSYYEWENIVYEYHFYGWDVEKDAEGQKAFIESKVKFLKEADFKVPVFVGEFTFFSNMKSWEYGLDIFDEQGWSYTSWTYRVAGDGSTWGMYTIPKNDETNVDIYNDSYETIIKKWSSFDFVRNDAVADILSLHFKGLTNDTVAPEIFGNDSEVYVGDTRTIEEIIDLYIKDNQDGVIDCSKAIITSLYDATKVGVYKVEVSVEDKAGNKIEAVYYITVKEKINDKDDVTVLPDNGDKDNSSSSPDKVVDTSDRTSIALFEGLALLSLLGLFCLRKKEFE